jgi:hypothetical protein
MMGARAYSGFYLRAREGALGEPEGFRRDLRFAREILYVLCISG